jgi:hypothetical protein
VSTNPLAEGLSTSLPISGPEPVSLREVGHASSDHHAIALFAIDDELE